MNSHPSSPPGDERRKDISCGIPRDISCDVPGDIPGDEALPVTSHLTDAQTTVFAPEPKPKATGEIAQEPIHGENETAKQRPLFTEWPSAQTLRALLRCSYSKCPCQREGRDVHCPAHDDRRPSLSLGESAEDGKPLWKCRAGCTQHEVTAALRHRITTDPLIAQIALRGTSADPMRSAPNPDMIQNTNTHDSAAMIGECECDSNADAETYEAETQEDGFITETTSPEDESPSKSEADEQEKHGEKDVNPEAAEAGPEAVESDVDVAETASESAIDEADIPCDQTPPRPLKTLRERGITNETRKHFGLEDYYQLGVAYHCDLTLREGRYRVKSFFPNFSSFFWMNGDEEKSRFYNIGAIPDDCERIIYDLYLVQGEADVWIMHQCGFLAISFIGSRDPRLLARVLVAYGVNSINIIFDNTLAGRRATLETCEVLYERIHINALLLEGAHGLSVTTLFERVGFNREKFRDEIETLRRMPSNVFDSWRNDPETMKDGLPEVGADDDGLLPCYSVDDLRLLPRTQALIEDMMLSEGVTLISGRHSSGKSFVALGMGLSVSQELPWQGKKTGSGAVFYFSAEGTEGLYNRICAWQQTHGVGEITNFAVVKDAVYIVDAAARQRVVDTVRAQLQKMGLALDGAALLIFDTLERYRGALNENDTNDMGLFMDAAEEIGRELGAAVLVVHHNNREGGHRGSSVLTDNAVGHLEISNPPSKGQGQKIKIRVAKLKDFAQGHSLTLGSQVVEIGGVDEFGKPLSSLVIVLDKSAETKGEQLSPKENDALQALLQLGDVGATSTVWKKAAAAKGVSSTSFDRARIKLLAEHAVECDNSDASGALYKAVEGWSDSPTENDEKNESDVEDDENETPLVPYHYQLKEGDPEVDEWNPVGEWIVRYKRES